MTCGTSPSLDPPAPPLDRVLLPVVVGLLAIGCVDPGARCASASALAEARWAQHVAELEGELAEARRERRRQRRARRRGGSEPFRTAWASYREEIAEDYPWAARGAEVQWDIAVEGIKARTAAGDRLVEVALRMRDDRVPDAVYGRRDDRVRAALVDAARQEEVSARRVRILERRVAAARRVVAALPHDPEDAAVGSLGYPPESADPRVRGLVEAAQGARLACRAAREAERMARAPGVRNR